MDVEVAIDPALELARDIAMPVEAVEGMLAARVFWAKQDVARVEGLMAGMTIPESAKASWSVLKELCGEDEGGWRILYVMLRTAACKTLPNYEHVGIGNDVFLATMGAFTRYVGESVQTFGRPLFDRDFWMWRHLCMRLFRVGTLEYEYALRGHGVPREIDLDEAVAVHIPSDADLTPKVVDESLGSWRSFVATYLPSWADLPLCCGSWLLSPELGKLLPSSSRILTFQRRFEIMGFRPDALDWRGWIFKTGGDDAASWPEDTSLQRAVKRHVLAGGCIGSGSGLMR